jgi:hypothetical protein
MKHNCHTKCLLLFVALMAIAASAQSAAPHFAGVAAPPSEFSTGTGDNFVHIMPTKEKYAELVGDSPMTAGVTYHGGPVVNTPNLYAILWNPPTLQNGTPTTMSVKFKQTVTGMLNGYLGHGLGNNLTQYYSTAYQCVGRSCQTSTFNIMNMGGFSVYEDTSPYPTTGNCANKRTGHNCVYDSQLHDEILKVMGSQGWSGGFNNVFLVFTSLGEGSCTNEVPERCSYIDLCAYHGSFTNGSSTVLYANLPYEDPPYCQITSNPPNDAAGDSTASVASHEVSEAITNPVGTAWYTDGPPPDGGQEIGDLCGATGTNTWDNGLANQYWGVNAPWYRTLQPVYFELQTEWDNHTGSCVQVGP